MSPDSANTSAPSIVHTTKRPLRLMVMIMIVALLSYATLIVVMNRPYGIHRYEIRNKGTLVGAVSIDLPIDFLPCEWRYAMPRLRRSIVAQVTVDYPSDATRRYSGTTECLANGPDKPLFFFLRNFFYQIEADQTNQTDGDVRFYQIDSSWQRLFQEKLSEVR